MKNLWNIPVLSVYFYAVTILTQYGYNSYFGIPSNFIEASIKENIIYFFQLLQIASEVAGIMGWWMWIVIILAVCVVLYLSNHRYQWVVSSLGAILLGVLLWGSYNFGELIAANTTNFYVLPSKCASINGDGSYIIPSFYDGKAILVSIDRDNKRTEGGFLIRNISDLLCEMKQEEIGRITK